MFINLADSTILIDATNGIDPIKTGFHVKLE